MQMCLSFGLTIIVWCFWENLEFEVFCNFKFRGDFISGLVNGLCQGFFTIIWCHDHFKSAFCAFTRAIFNAWRQFLFPVERFFLQSEVIGLSWCAGFFLRSAHAFFGDNLFLRLFVVSPFNHFSDRSHRLLI